MPILKVQSPFDGHLIQELPMSSENDIAAAMDSAEAVFADRQQWLPIAERLAILERLSKIIESRKSEIARFAALEGGKPLQDSEIEVARAISGIKVAMETIPHMMGKEIPMNLNASSAYRIAYTLREPVGLVLSISAFNHPVNLIIHQVVPAVTVGCPVVIKPASSTPLSCLTVVNALHEAGLPKAWCQAVITDGQTASKMVTDPRLSFLSFIGSSRVGWQLRAQLPPGAQCALEHGGVAPVIIEPDADIADALPLLVKGGFYHAGQVCVSVQRVYVHASLAQSVAEQIAARAAKLIVGDPLDPKTEVGPLIKTTEIDRIAEWVTEAANLGGKILCGGKKHSATCYEPTVILNPPDNAKVSTHEIFGPVVCVYSYQNREEAIARANQLPFCFQSAIFTKNIDIAFEMIKKLQATVVLVNDHTAFRVDWMPFGGRKQSGLNMGGIPYSMHDMMAEKMWVLRSPVL